MIKRKVKKPKLIIGWREWVSLPAFNIPDIKAKIDTGAHTSALHAIRIKHFERDGEDWVDFDVHPFPRISKDTVHCQAKVIDWAHVRSSNGKGEHRPRVRTTWGVGEHSFKIEMTLTNRSQMGFPLLIGREALRKRFVVDVSSSFLFGKPDFVKTIRRKKTL